MPLEEIKKGIESAASANAESIEEKAKKEKQEIIGEARKEVERIMKESADNISKERKRIIGEYSARTEIDARNLILSAKEEALDSELRKLKIMVAKRIRSSKNYPGIFKHALAYASSVIDGEMAITVKKEDQKFLGKTNASISNAQIDGGLIIRSKDGKITVNATVGALVDMNVEMMKDRLSKSLFGAGEKKKIERGSAKRTQALRAKSANNISAKAKAGRKRAGKKR